MVQGEFSGSTRETTVAQRKFRQMIGGLATAKETFRRLGWETATTKREL